jgi:hypothetical protein
MRNTKISIILILTLAVVFTGSDTMVKAQNAKNSATAKYPLKEDVSTIEGIIKASYEIVSGKAKEKRNWARDNSLHHKNARYYFFDRLGDQLKITSMSLEEFHKLTDEVVEDDGFYESEVNREVRVFGKMAHVWSTYETRLAKDGAVVRRGINSVQLLYENNRWFIVSWVFEGESKDAPIPKTFDRN